MLKKITLFLLVLTIASFSANIEIKDAYVRATPPGITNSAAFLSIMNNTKEDISLVKVTSNIAKNVEIHTHDMKDGVMKMYQVAKVDVKANSKTLFKPGSYHVMLLGLHKPLKENQNVDFTFIFSNDEKISITAPVKTVMGGMMKKKSHDMKSMDMKSNKMKSMSCGAGKCGAGMSKE